MNSAEPSAPPGSRLATLHRVCPNCGHDNGREPASPFSQGTWQIKACGPCGLVYLENAPIYEELKHNLAWEKSFALEKKRRQLAEPRLQYFNRRLLSWRKRWFPRRKLGRLIQRYFAAGDFLDVGCGAAKYLADLPEKFIPYGIEISETLAGRAQFLMSARRGSVINKSALDGLAELPAQRFAGAVMRAFLEHEICPRAVLREVARVLQPRGKLILKVPNLNCLNRVLRGARWCGFRMPDHVNYFTPSTLRILLENSGFQILRMTPFDRLPTSDNMWAVAVKRSL